MWKSGKLSELEIPIGMRNIKTTLAVFLCLVIYWLLGRGDSLLAVTSAIICMQSSVELSVTAGISRLAGTGIGALWGMALLLVKHLAPGMPVLVLASLGTMLLIWLCNKINQNDSIVMACIVFLVIILGESGDVSPFVYSLNRILDTFVGIAIAVVINRFVRAPARLEKHLPKPPAPPASSPASPDADEDEEGL